MTKAYNAMETEKFQYKCECPADPTGVQPKKLKCNNQNGAYMPNNKKLPGPILQKL